MMIDFNVLWRYFAWSNQTLAVFTLWACTVYLARRGKAFIITMLPAMFMTAVSVSYLLFARRPEGFGLDWTVATVIGVATATIPALILPGGWCAFAATTPCSKTEDKQGPMIPKA